MDAPSMEPWASLPHPCYVYCACFMPSATSSRDQIPLVATGAYDGSVRMWEVTKGLAKVSKEESYLANNVYHHNRVEYIMLASINVIAPPSVIGQK